MWDETIPSEGEHDLCPRLQAPPTPSLTESLLFLNSREDSVDLIHRTLQFGKNNHTQDHLLSECKLLLEMISEDSE